MSCSHEEGLLSYVHMNSVASYVTERVLDIDNQQCLFIVQFE